MSTAGLKPGDIVRVDKKGRRFYATFTERLGVGAVLAGGDLVIKPHDVKISYRRCTSREIVGIWRATADTRRKAAA